MNRSMIVATLGIVAAGSALAEPPHTGRALHDWCVLGRDDARFVRCEAFVAAVMDVMRDQSVSGMRACLRPDNTFSKAVATVVAHLKNPRDARYFNAANTVAKALSDAYPCK
jgi:hypothetical protein